MTWAARDLKDHPVPLLPWAGTPPTLPVLQAPSSLASDTAGKVECILDGMIEQGKVGIQGHFGVGVR